jgi:hypothetical protein
MKLKHFVDYLLIMIMASAANGVADCTIVFPIFLGIATAYTIYIVVNAVVIHIIGNTAVLDNKLFNYYKRCKIVDVKTIMEQYTHYAEVAKTHATVSFSCILRMVTIICLSLYAGNLIPNRVAILIGNLYIFRLFSILYIAYQCPLFFEKVSKIIGITIMTQDVSTTVDNL